MLECQRCQNRDLSIFFKVSDLLKILKYLPVELFPYAHKSLFTGSFNLADSVQLPLKILFYITNGSKWQKNN